MSEESLTSFIVNWAMALTPQNSVSRKRNDLIMLILNYFSYDQCKLFLRQRQFVSRSYLRFYFERCTYNLHCHTGLHARGFARDPVSPRKYLKIPDWSDPSSVLCNPAFVGVLHQRTLVNSKLVEHVIRYPPGQSTMVAESLHLHTTTWEIPALARPV